MSVSRGSVARPPDSHDEGTLPAPPSTLDPSVENAEYMAPAEELDDNFFLALTAPAVAVHKASLTASSGRHHHTAPSNGRDASGPQGHGVARKQVRFTEDVLGHSLSRGPSASSSSGSGQGDDDDGHHGFQSQVLQRHNDEDDEENDAEDDDALVGEDDVSGSTPTHAAKKPLPPGGDAAPLDDLDAKAFSAFPQPTPPASYPFFSRHERGRMTRLGYHTTRFGAFIKAYVGLSDKETEQAKRRGRSICMIGVTKSTRMRNITVRTGRPFLRHSVLAVEGDAVFAELIDRAEQLYALEHERVRQSLPEAWRAGYGGTETGATVDASGSPPGFAADTATEGYPGGPPFMWHSAQRKGIKVPEPILRPNARCIALHYGFPTPASSSDDDASGTSSPPASPLSPLRHEQFPRATLIAVICTTRLAENTEIYVSLESYYRCLDEIAWYKRCYGGRVRQGENASRTAASPPLDPDNALDGDIYTGVKRFHRWPKDLSYFHGIGKQHQGHTAEASFPFTLVDLADTPELGEKELGIRAAEFIPYATCFLYTGHSVATRKVEKLIAGQGNQTHNGDEATEGPPPVATPTTTSGKKKRQGRSTTATVSGARSSPQPAKSEPVNALDDEPVVATQEDYSFVTDDTYALSLGKHGVCFGQGLSRYINHRYNLSRFGNVELCSVMLSVPSEFSPTAFANKVAKAAVAAGAGGGHGNGKRKARPRKANDSTGSPLAGTEAGTSSAVAANKSKKAPRRSVKVTATTTTTCARSSSVPQRDSVGKGRRAAAVAAITAIQDFENNLNTSFSSFSASTSSDSEDYAATVSTSAAAVKREEKSSPSHMDMDDAAAAAVLISHRKHVDKRRRRPRATRMVFLEEQSHFVSVPFFIATADIEVGEPLLAWTYGEAYDAKLERQVVAQGSLVPYADAELLNRRYTKLEAQQRAYAREALKRGRAVSARHAHMLWQRYNGDYRYALGVGDLVWRRRPLEEVVTYKPMTKQGPIPCLPPRTRVLRCPPAEYDLFVIVQQMRSSVEKVLLKPLRRRWLPVEPLKQLLVEQDLAAYRSHAAPVSWRNRTALAESSAEATTLQPRLLLGAKVRQSRSASQGQPAPQLPVPTPTPAGRQSEEVGGSFVACAERLTDAWAVFDVSLQCTLEEMRECVVASTDTLALLLADVDYYIVQESNALRAWYEASAGGGAGHGSGASTSAAATAAAASSNSAAAAAVAKAQHLIVNLDDLRDATDLVRNSDRALSAPPLFNGLMWPLFHRQASNFGFECLYAADKKGPPAVKLEE